MVRGMSAQFPGTGNVRSGQDFRAFVAALPCEQDTAALFETCLRPIVYSRHHWLRYKGEYRVRADLRGILEDLQARGPDSWDEEESDYALSLYALCVAAVGLEELRDRVDCAMVREILDERFDLYADALGPEAGMRPARLLDLAEWVSAKRAVVETSHHLVSIIDGKTWYRTEGVIRRDEVDDETLTEPMEHVLAAFGVGTDGTAADRLAAAARKCVAEYGECAPLVRLIMAATLQDPVLRADHVTLTCPMGDLLGSPELMTTSEAFFVETQIRDRLELDAYAERLGHDSPEQLQRTIRARMLKLKRGAIRGLYGQGCLHGRFVEKHGGHMIFRNEDSHYRGHQSIGCSSGGRASFALRYSQDGEDRQLSAMVGDYRVVRMSHDEADLFTAALFPLVIRYAEWIRVVVEEAFRQGCVVRRDEPALCQTSPASLSAF